MKKEVIIAIIIGFSFGLVITVILHYTRQQTTTSTPNKDTSSITNIIEPSIQDQFLTIQSPQDGDIIDNKIVTIIGSTLPLSMLSFISPTDHITEIADENGNFTTTISVDSGPTIVSISSFDQYGNNATTTINIVYIPNSNEAEQ